VQFSRTPAGSQGWPGSSFSSPSAWKKNIAQRLEQKYLPYAKVAHFWQVVLPQIWHFVTAQVGCWLPHVSQIAMLRPRTPQVSPGPVSGAREGKRMRKALVQAAVWD
jgi:hypothetical protein